MKQSELEMLRTQAAKVELPQSVRKSVMAEAASLDQAEQQPSSGKRLTRRNFLRIGVAAAAVGVAAFLGLSIFGKSNNKDERGFVLTAFADELVSEDGTVLPVKNTVCAPIYGPSNVDGMYDAEYRFDLHGKVLGEGSGTITYELEGPYAQDALEDDLSTEPLIFFDRFNDGVNPNRGHYTKKRSQSFATVGGIPFSSTFCIKAHFPMSDALKAAIESGDKRTQLLESRRCFNKVLAETRLRITVEYSNSDGFLGITPEYGEGDVFEGLYAIEPTADFDETCGAYIDELLALEEQGYMLSVYGVANLSGHTEGEATAVREIERIEDEYWFYTIREIDG